jgi:hypothetical protein
MHPPDIQPAVTIVSWVKLHPELIRVNQKDICDYQYAHEKRNDGKCQKAWRLPYGSRQTVDEFADFGRLLAVHWRTYRLADLGEAKRQWSLGPKEG